ncbi:MAG TPA: class I SAM-dependent methyltransferase, partial [Acidimicrobiales bacterium]|nr:class I SAM-dependent methyltransferase [Acidimicrobiales bacterium]
EGWVEPIVQRLAGRRGRVVHAECGDGVLLGPLASAGVDVYGVDPSASLLDAAAGVGVDVRLEGGLEHLRSVPDASLDGVVVSGFVDHLSLGDQRDLVANSARALSLDGVMVIVGLNPDVWGRVASPIAVDLSPGRPLHAETWRVLLEHEGISRVEVLHGGRGEELKPVGGEGPAWDTMGSNLQRLNQLFFPPTTFLVVGIKQR